MEGSIREGRDVKRGVYKIAFGNIAGAENKDRDFWKSIEEWDVIVVCETWLERKGWNRIRGKLPRGYRWEAQMARRRNKKGRARGGMMIGVRSKIEIGKVTVEERGEGVMAVEIVLEGERWRIVGVYVNGDMESKIERIRDWMEEKRTGMKTLIGGDFNARTGERGGGVIEEWWEEGEGSRKSKDKKINREGSILLKEIEEMGWEIFNGGVKGDEEGEWTYTGGKEVIDYVIGNAEVKEWIEKMEVGDNIESDHHPILVEIKVNGVGGGREKKRRRKISKWEWSE